MTSASDDAPASDEESRERERRFLVRDASIVEGHSWKFITQAYFPAPAGFGVRVRIVQHLQQPAGPSGKDVWVGESAFLGVKGPRVAGERWEEELPLKDVESAKVLVAASDFVVQKRRYSFVDAGATWEVDIFFGANAGLVIAELEGKGDWIWQVAAPEWSLREITFDEPYNNEQLAVRPISTWASDWSKDEGDDDFDWLAE